MKYIGWRVDFGVENQRKPAYLRDEAIVFASGNEIDKKINILQSVLLRQLF